MKPAALLRVLTVAITCGCANPSDGVGDGTLLLIADAEDSITMGIEPGDGTENMADGFRVTFEHYVVALGDVTLSLASDDRVSRHIEDVVVVDLARLGNQGQVLFQVDDLAASDWQIQYRTAGAGHGTPRRDGSVSKDDFAAMVDADATYLIVGSLDKPDGLACPPRALARPGDATFVGQNAGGDPCYPRERTTFTWLLPAETAFGPCEVDGVAGFSIPEGGSRSVALSIHGDHIFFNGFPEGTEGGIVRLGQWLADSDLDLDGEVTQAELERIAPPDLAELDDRYALNVPFDDLRPVNDMWTYLRAQLKTQGHLDGEGECAPDGEAHDH